MVAMGRATGNGVRRTQIILGSAFAAASIIFLIVVHYLGIESEVMKVYFPYADELFNGTIPNMEYPPFAFIFLAIPRLFAATPGGYEIAFVAEAFIFFMIGMVVVGKLAKRFNQSQHQAMLAYTVLMLLMLEFVLDRYDIFPVIISLLSFYCFVTKRYVWAFALLSIATMTKLYPAVLFPIFIIPFLMNRDWSNTIKGTATFILVGLLVVLPFFLLGSDPISYFLEYHMDRPLQVESVAASIISVIGMLGLTKVWTEFGYGSDNLVGALPDAIAPYLTPIVVIALVVIYILYAYMLSKLRKDRRDNENSRMVLLGSTVVLALMVFIIMGKVFSAQYLLWVIPFIVFMLMTSIDHKDKGRILILSSVAMILTQLDFAVNVGISGGGSNITDIGMLIILARNIVVIILTIFVIKAARDHMNRRYWQPSDSD